LFWFFPVLLFHKINYISYISARKNYEKNISAKQQKKKKQAWFYEEKRYCRRQKSFVFKKEKGPQKAHSFLILL